MSDAHLSGHGAIYTFVGTARYLKQQISKQLNITYSVSIIGVQNMFCTPDALKNTPNSSHALRGNSSRDALRPVSLERQRLHSHAERGNDKLHISF